MLIQNDEITTKEKDLAEPFKKHYINVAEKSSEKKKQFMMLCTIYVTMIQL